MCQHKSWIAEGCLTYDPMWFQYVYKYLIIFDHHIWVRKKGPINKEYVHYVHQQFVAHFPFLSFFFFLSLSFLGFQAKKLIFLIYWRIFNFVLNPRERFVGWGLRTKEFNECTLCQMPWRNIAVLTLMRSFLTRWNIIKWNWMNTIRPSSFKLNQQPYLLSNNFRSDDFSTDYCFNQLIISTDESEIFWFLYTEAENLRIMLFLSYRLFFLRQKQCDTDTNTPW